MKINTQKSNEWIYNTQGSHFHDTFLDVSHSAFHSRAAAEPFQRLVARIRRRALIAMEHDSGSMAPPRPHIQ